MKILLLTALLTALPNGDREQGLTLYRAGKYAEAQAAFQRAIAGGDASAEVQWNLALAAFRAGDLATAELAAEKYAALAQHARPELHEGMLGAVRHEEAQALVAAAEAAQQSAVQPGLQPGTQPGTQPGGGAAADAPADPLPLLERALQKEQQAKDYFVRGATAAPTPELWRNTERSLQRIAELEQRIEELKKQREQQQQQQDDGQKNDEKKDDQPKPDQPKPDEQQQDEPQQDKQQQDQQQQNGQNDQQQNQQQNQQPGEQQPEQQPQKGNAQQPPEPQQQPGERQEPKPDQAPPEQQPEPQPSDARSDAPGEGAEGKELTPEQAQRLLERLKDLDKKLGEARGRARTGRKPVGRDW